MRPRSVSLFLACSLTTSLLGAQSTNWTLPTPDAPDSFHARADAYGHVALATVGHVGQTSGAQHIAPMGWSALGPFGGDVDDVASSPTSPNVVLAGLAPSGGLGGTLFRSTDAGASWTEVAALSGTSVHDIEFSPAGTAYIGTIDGVWTSGDDGATWSQLALGIGLNDQVFEVTLDPQDATRIWVGVGGALGNQTQNILLSTNSGASWSDMTPAGASGTSGQAIAVHPTNSSEVVCAFAGSFGGGSVWTSSNGGSTWTDRSAGLPANPMRDLDHDGTRILLAGGQLFGTQNVGLYETTNLGVSWTAVHDGSWPSLVIHDIEVDPASPMTIYAASAGSGIFRSTDGGTSWTFGLAGALSVNEVHVAGAEVYSGSSSVAVWKSTGGVSWSPSSVGIGSLNLESVAVNPNDSDELAAAFQGLNDGGVYSSTDGGITWGLEALPGTRFNTVRFAPDGTLYSISDGPTTVGAEGVYRRTGASWASIGPDQGSVFESELYGLTFSDTDSNLLISSGSDFGVEGFEPTVWVSTDFGVSWLKNYEGINSNESVRSVAILPDGSDQNMVGAYTDFGAGQDGGALRSADGGSTWVEVNTGIAAGAQCYSVAVSAFDSDTVYLTDDDFPTGAIYRSTDAALTWTSMGFAGRVRSVVASPLRAERIFIGSSDATKVLVSDDGGATTASFDTGLSGAGFVRDLALFPNTCGELLLATTNGAYGEDGGGCMLEGDQTTISLAAGAVQSLDLAAGPDQGLRFYAVIGSLSGTTPATPVGSIVLPLKFDSFFLTSINNANSGIFNNTINVLDPDGRGSASVTVPAGANPSLAGKTLSLAFGVFTLSPFVTYTASNAVSADLVP